MMCGMGPCIGQFNIPNLTSNQIIKIQQLGIDFQNKNLPLNKKIQTKQLEFQSFMNGSADQNNLEAKIEEINQLRTNFKKKWLAYRQNIRKLLNDDQKAWFDLRGFGMRQGYRCFSTGWYYGDFGRRGWGYGGNRGGLGRRIPSD